MTLYEDALVIATLAENAAVKGHVIVQPKKPVKYLRELSEEDCAHLFTVASYTAAILFQGLQAEGTNIICNEDEEQLTIHVVARRKDDGLNFQWEPKELDEGTMNDTFERVKDKSFYVGKKKPEPVKEEKPKGPVEEAEDEENYLIQQLLRIP
ncbi:HIT family protein [Candidatus Woesearchaeota archaeon]|nr:HIT family protein [Candidatus Woesearchaeota archaeon]